MQVRIRLTSGMPIRQMHYQSVALAVSSLLTPCALVAFTLTFWSIAAEMHWSNTFFISTGLFSHWQIWLASAGLLLLLARVLARPQSANEE